MVFTRNKGCSHERTRLVTSQGRRGTANRLPEPCVLRAAPSAVCPLPVTVLGQRGPPTGLLSPSGSPWSLAWASLVNFFAAAVTAGVRHCLAMCNPSPWHSFALAVLLKPVLQPAGHPPLTPPAAQPPALPGGTWRSESGGGRALTAGPHQSARGK